MKKVNEFLENYSAVLEKQKFEAYAIWNVDETGLTTI